MIPFAIACTKPLPYRSCLLLALSLSLLSARGWSQSQLGTVFGTITDRTGAVIPGAEVTVVNVGTGLKRDASTDINGRYHVSGLPPGRYTVRVEKENFQ